MTTGVLLVLIFVFAATAAAVSYVNWIVPRRLEARYRAGIQAFSTAISLRFPEHGANTERVVRLATILGKRIGLSPIQISDLEMAAQLRDIGLCATPYRLLNERDHFTWTSAERHDYDQHPVVSASMLELVPSLARLAPIVRNHHTSFGGASGPSFPSHENIPIEARIVCLAADFVWEEQRVDRAAARQMALSGAGRRYDPKLVEELVALVTFSEVEIDEAVGVA